MQWLVRRLSSSARETNLEEMLTLIQLCGKLEASHVMSNVSYFRTYPGRFATFSADPSLFIVMTSSF